MFSNKSSRASSIQSLLSSLGENSIPEYSNANENESGNRMPPQEEMDSLQHPELHGDTTLNPSIQLSVTQAHPLGRIFLGLLKDTIQLAKKSNIKEMETDIQDLCSNFYNSVRLEKAKSQKQLKQAVAEIHESLINKELNGHLLNQDADPPTYFSPSPTLLTAHQRAEAMRLFPCRNKFSGYQHKGNGMDISEFLSTIKTAQEQCRLSEKEFKELLLQSTTGKAHSLLSEWISSKDTVATIFHSFLIHFDKRISPEECKQQLFVYKAPKTSNLARVESHIMSLAHRASTLIPAGESRNQLKDMEIIQALIRCLPQHSSTLVQNTYSSLSARLERGATANELSRALNLIRHSIDLDIRQNGVDQIKRSKMVPNTTNMRNKKYTTYAVSPATAPIVHKRNVTIRSPTQNNTMRTFVSNSHGRGMGRRNFSRPSGPNNNRFKPRFSSNQTRPNRPGFSRTSNFHPNNVRQGPTDYCSLCGKKDHTANDGCPHMVTDQGVTVGMMPTHGTCSLCPTRISPRLNHPSAFCPYRKNGPFSNSQ